MTTIEFTACACDKCRTACLRNPGWFLPEEARAAIRAGYAKRMMRDWLEPSSEAGNDDRIYILAPASEGHEGDDAPDFDFFSMLTMFTGGFKKGRCVLHTEDGRCEIHSTGFKPFQCRTALLCNRTKITDDDADSNFSVARAWDTDLGRAVVAEWQEKIDG